MMMKITRIYFAFAIFLLSGFSIFSVENQQILKNKMINDLNIIRNTLEVKYAPAEWKRQFACWNLDHEAEIATARILSSENITITTYQRIVKDFLKSTKDYHVGIHFYSTASAFLPFRLQSSKDRYFVTWVDSSNAHGLAIGDEILTFDNKPIHEAVTELKKRELGNPDSPTDQAFAELFFTARLGELGHEIPNGNVTVVAKRANSTKTTQYRFKWDYTPESVSSPIPMLTACKPLPNKKLKKQPLNNTPNALSHIANHPYFHKNMSVALYEPIHAAFEKHYRSAPKEADQEAEILGARRSMIPRLGQVIWEAPLEHHLHAYIFKNANTQKLIGYIRIPEYMGGTPCAEEFAEVINLFQRRTEALVIDQLNNPGGELFYMYALLSMLNPTSLNLPTQRLTITQQDVFNSLEILTAFDEIENGEFVGLQAGIGETISGYPLDENLVDSMKKHFEFIVKEWDEGRCFTNPTHVYGIKTLHPHPKACYTKPILVLVNALDFSCGDFLPAILQDNQRATIFGTKTAGAGGILLSHSHPNRFGIANYTFTGSIAEREDKAPIENLGVTPDIVYEMTERDFQSNYAGYVSAVNQALESLIKQKKPRK